MNSPHILLTGCAGFIGSFILEHFLKAGYRVRGYDNFSTGSTDRLKRIQAQLSPTAWKNFELIEGDIRDRDRTLQACEGIHTIIHQAALVSVPASITSPETCFEINELGTHRLLMAAKQAGVSRFVYASSSAVYGEAPVAPQVESQLSQPLSPYAVSKLMNELHAAQFARHHGLTTVGLRYFNIFGRGQDPRGPYAAVIPLWIEALKLGRPYRIYGDGTATRDFCHVGNVVLANEKAVLADLEQGTSHVVNVATGQALSLNELALFLRESVAQCNKIELKEVPQPEYHPERIGDIPHSVADISHARQLLQFEPLVQTRDALAQLVHDSFLA